MRRTSLVIVLAALLLASAAAPASAVIQSNESIIGAEADWTWSGEGSETSVHIRVVESRLKADDTPSGHTVGMNVQVFRTWTDANSGSTVTEFLMTDPFYAPATALDIHRLTSAAATASVALSGMRWTDDDAVSVGPLTVAISADWLVSGTATRERSREWSTERDEWSRRDATFSSAPARASASMTGDLELGDLGTVEGQLVVLRDRAMRIEAPVVPLMVAASVAAGTTGERLDSHVLRAVGGWTLDDGSGSELWLTVEQPFTARDGRTAALASAELNQGFCDPVTGESVMRMLTTQPTAVTSGGVSQSLSGATASVTLVLSGAERRAPGCDDGSGEPTWTEVSFTATIDVAWTATGELDFYRTQHTVWSADGVIHARSQAKGRQAVTSGSVTGELGTSALTDAINAYVEDRHDTGSGGEPG
jgi:hypothetical protein